MRCPFCRHREDRVIDSRESKEGAVTRRRRECLQCHRRYTSYERIEEITYFVIKKGGYRQPFDRAKVLSGLTKACEKRPVSPRQLEQIVDRVEQKILTSPNFELASEEIGHFVMQQLKQLDKVAYVRFASVYLDFKDIREFTSEIDHLTH